jgi:nitrite reductase/ring-hydroxylating ferredoxin subunit/uncharacterized membrane protein
MTAVIRGLISKLGNLQALDKASTPASAFVQRVTGPTPVKNALSGVWLGHQLHPMLTDVPIGAWSMASLLDLSMGRSGSAAARRLVGVGILAAVPTAASGASDWSSTYGPDQRVGLVHATANATATTLQVTSWLMRRRGRHGTGVALSTVALGLTASAGYLGGHLSYTRGIGVNHDAFEKTVSEWTDVSAVSEVTEGALVRVEAAGVPVLLVRRGGSIHALSATCDHAGGPLNEGELVGDCVRCPWHASMFRLSDGTVVHGPATAPQPLWEVKVSGERVHVRSAG